MSNLLVLILRKKEEVDPAFDGIVQQECVNEYLQHAQLDTEADLEKEVRVVKCIIQRLVTKDHVLIVTQDNSDVIFSFLLSLFLSLFTNLILQEAKRKLAVHPNYAEPNKPG
mmetsp:Transcript_38180/g.60423  ORF Transcript_38180/g.60423 Transcript_38180/m.60423 type:complete len:112 (-) Transcript_38180:536-871(-)